MVGSYSFTNSYYNSEDSGDITKSIGVVVNGKEEIDFELGDADNPENKNGIKTSFKGLTRDQMTGSDALDNMVGLEEAYTAAPNDDGYPQLSIFVTDPSNPEQFPIIVMAE